ncbi:VOC family protein [Streptomyces sp. NPDC048297]|uniref:VOC family protein n=1 Tax=Streptomyces sp. NPDC048297 TaxID=3365531 RepID=UPI003714AFF3
MQTIWIEIPAEDLERAKRFYEAVFQHEPTEIVDMGVRRITILPGTPSVSLNQTDGFVPSTLGALPYFHVDEPLSEALERVTANGGSVVDPTEERPGNGFFALVLDSEGNAVTLHSAQK